MNQIMFDVPAHLIVHVLHLTHDFTFFIFASLILGFLSVIDRTRFTDRTRAPS